MLNLVIERMDGTNNPGNDLSICGDAGVMVPYVEQLISLWCGVENNTDLVDSETGIITLLTGDVIMYELITTECDEQTESSEFLPTYELVNGELVQKEAVQVEPFTVDDFKDLVSKIQNEDGYRMPIGFGINVVSTNSDGEILMTTYPVLNWGDNFGSAAIFEYAAILSSCKVMHDSDNEVTFELNPEFVNKAMELFEPYIDESLFGKDEHQNVQVIMGLNMIMSDPNNSGQIGNRYRLTYVYSDQVVETIEAAYMKLYALSLGKAELRTLNLNGIFGLLPTSAWIGNVPIGIKDLKQNAIRLKLLDQYPAITAFDKFPRFLHNVIPEENVRILDDSKVRMGAQLAKGTTVMPGASYINFNAGTNGPVMVEGRISSSAMVGAGTDIGGGASILGTLSGGNDEPITVGMNCLLEANSVTGISLGDECIVSANMAILSGTNITILNEELVKILEVNSNPEINTIKTVFKGRELSGMNGITYRVNNLGGHVEAIRTTRFNKLNPELH